jgi:O-acetyl-ADP-ribose deacetylase (regulator of RNase III)
LIKAVIGDITKLTDVKYICNAANGKGPMGAGVAGAIARAGGEEIVKDAFRVCREKDPKEGDLYVTTAGTLPYDGILHLVTMKNPGGKTSYDIVRACLKSLVSYCKLNNIEKVALPALGTGVGGLSLSKVATIFSAELSPIEATVFTVVDINEEFISFFASKGV